MANIPVEDDASARAAAIRAERTGRGVNLTGDRMRLQVREDLLDRTNWVYRWGNDIGNRIYHLMSRGYDAVSDRSQGIKADGVGMGAEVAQLVDTTDHGAPVKARLMRIPRPIYEEDQRAKQNDIDQKEAAHINPGGELQSRDTRLTRSSSPAG